MVASLDVASRAELVHQRLVHTREQRRVLDSETARLLRIIDDERLFEVFGHASIFQYAEQEHGIKRGPAGDYLRVARRLDSLPEVARAFAAGELDKTKVRDIVRVATPSTEKAWVERAKVETSRVLEQLVKSVGSDGMPPDAVAPAPLKPDMVRRTYVLHAAEADAVDQVVALLRSQFGEAGRDITNGTILAIVARFTAMHAEIDHLPANAEPYQIVLTKSAEGVCCGGHHVNETMADEAACDAVITDMQPGPEQGSRRHSIPPRARVIALAEHNFRCAAPDCEHRLFLDVHHISGRDVPRAHHPRNLVALCPGHHRVVRDGHVGVERLPCGELEVSYRHGRRPGRPVRTGPSRAGGCPAAGRYPGLKPLLEAATRPGP